MTRLPDRARIDRALLDAHARGAADELAPLYARAADLSAAAGDEDAACFYLVHAYVFALDAGLDAASEYHARLKARGREE